VFSGVIGSKNQGVAGNNAGTAFVALTGVDARNFEDVLFASVNSTTDSLNNIIHATGVTNGVLITTVTGSGVGVGAGTGSPSVIFNSRIQLDSGGGEAQQNALLTINAGSVNSTVGFSSRAGVVVDDGGNVANQGFVGAVTMAADYVYFDGLLSGRALGALALS